MARRSAADYCWEQLQRVLLAWQAVRLDPAYRRDWEENKHYVHWAHSLPANQRDTIYVNSEPMQWLRKLGQKWDFSNILVDPDLKVPLRDRQSFHKCTRHCATEAAQPNTQPSGTCLTRYMALASQCPFSPAESFSVFLACPYSTLFGNRPPTEWRKALGFDERIRRQDGWLVLWIALGNRRRALLRQIREQIDRSIADLEKSGRRNPRIVQKKKLIEVTTSHEFLVLGINLRGSKRLILPRITKLLTQIPQSIYDRTGNKLSEGLSYYEQRSLFGRTMKDICISNMGRKAWSQHVQARRLGDKSPGVRRIQYLLSQAELFIERGGFRSLVQSRNDVISWEQLSPKKPPSLPTV